MQLQELKQLEHECRAAEAQLSRDVADLNSMQHVADKYTTTQQK